MMPLEEATEVQASGQYKGRDASQEELQVAELVTMHFARINTKLAAMSAERDEASMEP